MIKAAVDQNVRITDQCVASDSLIALNRFHFDGAHSAASAIRYWIIILYWLGQLGITASALRFSMEFSDPYRVDPRAAS